MNTLTNLANQVKNGSLRGVSELVMLALEEGFSAQDILDNGLMRGMNDLGVKFRDNVVFVPEVLNAAKAFNVGTALLREEFTEDDIGILGTVVLATVEGDLHDLGKNIVKYMLEGVGLRVIDLGSNVSAERIVEAVKQHNPDIVALSALLTTTMLQLKVTIDAITEAGMRQSVKVVVGGAPISKSFSQSIGADYYFDDAAAAAKALREILTETP